MVVYFPSFDSLKGVTSINKNFLYLISMYFNVKKHILIVLSSIVLLSTLKEEKSDFLTN